MTLLALPFEVRIVDRDGALWWFATDVAKALGYRSAPDMTRYMDEDELTTLKERSDKYVTNSDVFTSTLKQRTYLRGSDAALISESGLFRAILRSRRAEAKRFQRWVVHDVLPSIRRYGFYDPARVAAAAQLAAIDQHSDAPAAATAAERFLEERDRLIAESGLDFDRLTSLSRNHLSAIRLGGTNMAKFLGRMQRWQALLCAGADVHYILTGIRQRTHSDRTLKRAMDVADEIGRQDLLTRARLLFGDGQAGTS